MKIKYEIMRKDGLIESKILEHLTKMETIDNNGIKFYFNIYNTVTTEIKEYIEVWPQETIFKMEIIP